MIPVQHADLPEGLLCSRIPRFLSRHPSLLNILRTAYPGSLPGLLVPTPVGLPPRLCHPNHSGQQ